MKIEKVIKFTRNYKGLLDERISTWLYHRYVRNRYYSGITWFDKEDIFLHYNSKEYIERRIWMTGEYEPEIWKAFQLHISEGAITLDIGANIGVNSIRMSKLVGENGKVFSIEPFEININRFNKNINLNGIKNVELVPFAFGNKDELKKVHINLDEENLGSLSLRNNKPGDILINVKIGDDWILHNKIDKIDFIKIDVEGYEWNVIDGLKNTIAKCHPKIIIEWDTNYQLDAGIDLNVWNDFIEKNNYHIYQIDRYGLNKIDNINEALNGNILLI